MSSVINLIFEKAAWHATRQRGTGPSSKVYCNSFHKSAGSFPGGQRADGAPFDLNEFGRLLNSGKSEDLQKIARALSQRDNVRI